MLSQLHPLEQFINSLINFVAVTWVQTILKIPVSLLSLTAEIIEKIHGMVMKDRILKVYEMSNTTVTHLLYTHCYTTVIHLFISNVQVYNILHQHLPMRKLSARWVPCVLTINQKLEQKNIYKHGVELFLCNWEESLWCFITVGYVIINLKLETARTLGCSRRMCSKKAKIIPIAGT